MKLHWARQIWCRLYHRRKEKFCQVYIWNFHRVLHIILIGLFFMYIWFSYWSGVVVIDAQCRGPRHGWCSSAGTLLLLTYGLVRFVWIGIQNLAATETEFVTEASNRIRCTGITLKRKNICRKIYYSDFVVKQYISEIAKCYQNFYCNCF